MRQLARLPHLLCLASALALFAAAPARADQWTPPTPEELSMTSQPEVPGAPAVYLFREEITEDKLHMHSFYVRLKVLSDRGKDFANVELPYTRGDSRLNVAEISGRTIHPDGTVVPFTGKPYDKLIERVHGSGVKFMAKVFSLPDVGVGSILEYRYKYRYDDNYFIAPQWYIQSDLFTRHAHYVWKPTTQTLVSSDDRGQLTSTISWTPILPAGVKVVQTSAPRNSFDNEATTLQVEIKDVPPAPDEEYMPPIKSFSYRVLFYYTPYRTMDEFWKNEGKFWAKRRDKFIGPGPAVSGAVAQLTSPGDAPSVRLRKLYNAVQGLENTDLTREHSTSEDKSQGLGEVHTTDDIWNRKRGSGDQLAELFVALARAAGFKAYLMGVADRSRNIFYPAYLSLGQLEDYIAIVNVDGKEAYFDPGTRFCPYGHLAWRHTLAGGLRQTDGATALGGTPPESYTASRIQRVANLKMDEHGTVSGTVKMTYIGAPAIHWRERSVTGDIASLHRELQTSLEDLLPHGMEVKVTAVDKLTDFEQPLEVLFDVKGEPGSSTGKRLLLPGDLFEANAKPLFPHDKRTLPVYFEYPHTTQDAIRITFPSNLAVESAPPSAKLDLPKEIAYTLTTETTPTSLTTRRNFVIGKIIFPTDQYPKLRTFYTDMLTKDTESFVLKTGAAPTEKASATTPPSK